MSIFEFIKVNNLELLDDVFCGYKFPPIYQIFLKNFDLGINANFTPTLETGDTFGNFYLFNISAEYSGVCITNFFSLKELFDDNDYSKNNEILINYNLIRIGTVSIGGGVCIGTGNENLDKIYLYIGDEKKIVHLSNDIFNFLKTLRFEIDDFNDFDKNSLYKNWNEDFWRIKPPDFRDARPYELLDKDRLDKRYSELKKSKVDLLEIENEYKIRGLDLPKKFLFW